jgi:hypothetical protein
MEIVKMSDAPKKPKRRVIGSVLKSKDNPKQSYFKVGQNPVTLRPGETLSLESKEEQLASLDRAVEAGKLSPELAEKSRERINKIPDFVRFEVVQKFSE